MAKASAPFGSLRQRLWNNHHMTKQVKGKIYRAIVLSILLHGAEAWTVYRRYAKKLHAFMMRHLRSIMWIICMDKVTNKDILELTGPPSMEDLLITSRECHQTRYQSRFATLNCLLVTSREGSLVSCVRIPPR
ncbi:hypothetical protein NP493_171g04013 [Ridgeia piscesae]|uniref:Uncharacterized protein n=1 Tax=Ridgeia piscesae TaxID=27915 RepID=A0AAD9UF86_RIDPI|nr:hypothetical protein NP493_171g04013 [Ridgeia piscesae]